MITVARALVGVGFMAIAVPSHAQEPSLPTVLERAGAYVLEFQRQLSGIVAEERYVQEVLTFTKRRGCPADATYSSILRCQGQVLSPVRKELRSDLLLVRPAGARSWTEFRDVFEADGVPVRDRTERLTKLFLDGSAADRDQVGRILDERDQAQHQHATVRAADSPAGQPAALQVRPRQQPCARHVHTSRCAHRGVSRRDRGLGGAI